MLKQHSSFVKQLIAGVDCVLILFAFYLANAVVFGDTFLFSRMFDYWVILVGFMGFYLYFAWTRSLFSILDFSWTYKLIRRVGAIFVSAGMLGAAILYMLPRDQSSRHLYVAFAGIAFVFIIVEKLMIRQVMVSLRRNNRNITPMILVGRGRILSQIYQEIICHPEWGLRINQKLDMSITPAEFEEVLRNSYTEEVCFCIPRKVTIGNFSIDPYLRICEEMGRPARVFLNISGATTFARWEYHRFMDRPTLISHTVELDPDQVIFKRFFDILGGLVGLAILVTLYPLLAVAIKVTSRGPVLFRQVRVGKNGKRFVIYKFRSMAVDAELRKKELMANNELNGAVFKMKNDPRVTPIGRFMRKFSLDEFPQMINVLKGEMSLVGTRPPTPDEVANYQKWHYRRISIRPGLTGLWQVSGRNRIKTFDDIVKLDLTYIDNWSIWLDLKIIIKTFLVLFQRDSAF